MKKYEWGHDFGLLWIALLKKHTKVVEVLLAADMDKESEVERAAFALEYAALFNNGPLVKLLLSADFKLQLGTDFTYSASVMRGAMLKAMKDRSYGLVMDELVTNKDMTERELERTDKGLRACIMEDDIPYTIQDGTEREMIVIMLLDEDTEYINDVDQEDYLFLTAIRSGFVEMVRILLEREHLKSWRVPYSHPLIVAAQRGNKAIMKMLLDTGVFPGASTSHLDDNPLGRLQLPITARW